MPQYIYDMRLLLTLILGFCLANCSHSQDLKTRNVILITYDGLRWQELFKGLDTTLLNDARFTPENESPDLTKNFWDDDKEVGRSKLLPFFWSTIKTKGQLHGNRDLGSKVNVTNQYWFSYPGYNEILTGFADDKRITSNDKIPNPNKTVLEFVNDQPDFSGRVAAFTSWDVFPYIINEQRSGIPVNAGFEAYERDSASERIRTLNQLQKELPRPWATVRNDAFTHHFAMEYLKTYRPRLLYVAYGETDDFAHDGRYDHYLRAAHQTDHYISQIWNWVQSDPEYKDKTTLMITTDHGRGTVPKEDWRHHGTKIQGADQIWIAVLGPDSIPLGEIDKAELLYQNQVASTTAYFLGLKYNATSVAGGVPGSVIK